MSEDGTNIPGHPPIEDLEDLYENAPCGYLSIQTDGRIFKANATFAAWTGYSPEELIGTRLHDLLNVAGRIFYETHFAPLLRMQGFFNEVALDLRTMQGTSMPVLINAAEKRDAEGKHLFTRLTIFNATDRRRYERELVEARKASDTAKKELQALHDVVKASLANELETAALREQFIAVLGHDLRNPLAAIFGATHILRKASLDDKAMRLVVVAQDSAERMAGLIDNIMDLARGRLGGGLSLSRAVVPIEPTLRKVVSELQTSAAGRTIETHFAIPTPVKCDLGRIGQLLSNLLGNAITYGAADKPIRVGAFITDGQFELFVSNAGDPIPPKVMADIFLPFSRGNIHPSLQGLGLGLYISREIATAHGGTLDVVSTLEETRFTFRMPLLG